MRHTVLLPLCLAALLVSGCRMFDPDSKLNVNRGVYHDEFEQAGREGRGDRPIEKAPDGLGNWLYDPKTRAINRSLGVED